MDVPRAKLLLNNLGLVVAKQELARHWRAPKVPNIAEWKKDMDLFMAEE